MNIETQIDEIDQNLKTLTAVRDSMANDLAYDLKQLEEAKAGLERLAESGAGDDEMDEAQDYITERTRILERSQIRHRASVIDLEKAEAKAKGDKGRLHQEAGNAFLGGVVEKQKKTAELAGQIVALTGGIKSDLDNANFHRREAKAFGVMPINPGMPPVDIGDAIQALRLIAGASRDVWHGIYG